MASTVLFISGDSYGAVHLREWKVKQTASKHINWHKEFDQMLTHYQSQGHKVVTEFGQWDERLIHAIRITGHFEIVEIPDD